MLSTTLCAQQTVTISDTEQQSGFNGYTQGNDPNHNTAPITANPFNFTGQTQLSSISSISITLTIFDGDTGLGPNATNDTPYPPDGTTHADDDDFVNTLHLHLNGIETANLPSSGTATPPALLLNGFSNWDPNTPVSQGFIRLTISGTPANATAILNSLQSGTIAAQLFDAGFADRSNSSQNTLALPAFQFNDMTGMFDTSMPIFATLSITGIPVPEPSPVALLVGTALTAAVTAHVRSARKRRSA
ncbi:MAG: hypothetical protein ACJ8M1_01515 [Chthoniobacterales bacterium]